MIEAMVKEVHQNTMDGNNVLTSAGVKPLLQGHNEDCGIAGLIMEILTEKQAVFPLGVETTEFRPVVIAASKFALYLAIEVQSRFAAGSTRYPIESVKQYLSVFLARPSRINKVIRIGKFQLSKSEDAGRPCCKPRTKYYWIQGSPAFAK